MDQLLDDQLASTSATPTRKRKASGSLGTLSLQSTCSCTPAQHRQWHLAPAVWAPTPAQCLTCGVGNQGGQHLNPRRLLDASGFLMCRTHLSLIFAVFGSSTGTYHREHPYLSLAEARWRGTSPTECGFAGCGETSNGGNAVLFLPMGTNRGPIWFTYASQTLGCTSLKTPALKITAFFSSPCHRALALIPPSSS